VVLIVIGIVVLAALVGGFVMDRRDRRGTGASRKASDMTRGAMRHRQQYGRRSGR
jgi:hypothetical protein